MANIKTIFKGSEDSEFTENTEMECFVNTVNTVNEVTVSINDGHDEHPTIISLDIPTAIKFAKVLRANINKIKNQ